MTVEPLQQKKSRSSGTVYLGLAVLVILAVGGFILAYFKLVHYQRRVLHHVPVDAVAAVRLDFQQLLLFEPVRRHLFPLADKWKKTADEPALDRFKEETGVDLAMDLREAVLAFGPDRQWALAIGGLFPENGIVGGLAEMLQEDGVGNCGLQGSLLRCEDPQLWVGQSTDRVVVVASSETQLGRALARSEGYMQLGMTEGGAGSLGLNTRAFAPILNNPLALLTPGVSTLRRISRVNAELVLAERAEVEFRLTPQPGQTAAVLAPAVEQLLSGLRALSTLPGLGSSVGGELLARATVTSDENGLMVRSFYTSEELDRVARMTADWLARALEE